MKPNTMRDLFVAVILFAVGTSMTPLVAANVEQGSSRQSAGPSKIKLYVALFNADRAMDGKTLTSITNDVETALLYSGCVVILERRTLDRLLEQILNERRLSTVRDLGLDATRELRGEGATAVMFGEIDDDVNSGEIIVRAQIEQFD